MQKQIPMIHDVLFRISKLLPPIDYFQQLLLIGRFCFNHELYTIAIKEFYDKIVSERRNIDLSVESDPVYVRQFELLWKGIQYESDLYRFQCIIFSILELDPHLEYIDKRKEIIQTLFTIQKLISEAIENNFSLLLNYIYNTFIVLSNLIEMISHCGAWKEIVMLLVLQVNQLIEIVPQHAIKLELGHEIIHQDYIILLQKNIKLLCYASEQYFFSKGDIDQYSSFLKVIINKIKQLVEDKSDDSSIIINHFSNFKSYLVENISFVKYKQNRAKLLQSLEYSEVLMEGSTDPKAKGKKPKGDTGFGLESLLTSLQYTGTPEEIVRQFQSSEKNSFVEKIVKFVTLQHRAFFRHAPPESLYSNTIVKYIEIAMLSLNPYLSLYRKYYKLEPEVGDCSISKDMFENVQQGVNINQSSKQAKGKTELAQSLTEEDINILFKDQYPKLDIISLYALTRICFHYEQWSYFDSLLTLVEKIIADQNIENKLYDLYLIIMKFIRQTIINESQDPNSRRDDILELLHSFSSITSDLLFPEMNRNTSSLLNESILRDDLVDATLILSKWVKFYFQDEPPHIQSQAYKLLFNVVILLDIKNLNFVSDFGIRLALYYEDTHPKESLTILRFILQQICLSRETLIFNESHESEFTVLKDIDNQWLYCLHAEVVSHIYRCELKYGIFLKEKHINKIREKDLKSLTKKSENPELFGKLYDRDKKTMKELEIPGEKPKNNKNYEQKLLKDAGYNYYELAICNMLISNFRDTSKDKSLFLQKSIEYLLSAEDYEKRLDQQVKDTSSEDFYILILKPSARRLLIQVRTKLIQNEKPSESIDLIDDDPIDFVVYGKQQLLGESMVTPSDIGLVGTGSKWDPNQNISISELEPNQLFSFAAQEFDPYGEAISELSKMSTSVVSMYPLPLILCWCYVTQTAFKSNSFKDALKSGFKVLEPYLNALQPLPMWEQNPLKELSLDEKSIETKANQLLMKEIIKCSEIIGDIQMKKHTEIKPSDHPPNLDPNQLSNQISRLRVCNYYLMAIGLSEKVKDSSTVVRISEKIEEILSPILFIGSNQLCKFLLDALLHVVSVLSSIASRQFREYKTQRIACSLLLSISSLATNIKKIDVYHQITTHFYNIFEKIYQGCIEDKKNPIEMSQDVHSLTQALFFNRLLVQPLLENKPITCHIDEIYFAIAPSLKDPKSAFGLLNTKFRDNPLYPRFAILILRAQLSLNQGFDTIDSKLLSTSKTELAPQKSKDPKAKPTTENIEVNIISSPHQTLLELICSQIEFSKLFINPQSNESTKDKKDKKPDPKKVDPKAKKGTEISSELENKENTAKLENLVQRKKYKPIISNSSAIKGFINYLMSYETQNDASQDQNNSIKIIFQHFFQSITYAIEFNQYKTIFNIGIMMKNVLSSFVSLIWQSKSQLSIATFANSRNEIISSFKLLSNSFTTILQSVREGNSIDASLLQNLSKYVNEAPTDIANVISFRNAIESDPVAFKLPWIDRLVDVDIQSIVQLVELTLDLMLTSQDQTTEVITLAESFNDATSGTFCDKLLPYIIESKRLLNEDTSNAEQQLKESTKDIPINQLKLNLCRDVLKKYSFQLFKHFEQNDTPLPNISSLLKQYENTLAAIRAKHEVDLLFQSLNELADIYILNEEPNKAASLWAEALDNSVQIVDTLNNLKLLPENPLQKYGFWNLTIAIDSASKLGRYKLKFENDIHSCTKACVLISKLVLSLFTISVQNAQRFCDFASYDVLQFGRNIFNNSYKCNQISLTRALQFASHFLVQTEQYNLSLPVSSLFEYFSRFILNDKQLTIDARLTKSKALIEIGNLNDAFTKIRSIIQGQNLPDTFINQLGIQSDRNLITIAELEKFTGFLNQSRSLESEQNQEFLKFVTSLDLNCNILLEALGERNAFNLVIVYSSFLRKLASCDQVQCIATGNTSIDDKNKAKKPSQKGTAEVDTNLFQTILQSAESRIQLLLTENNGVIKQDIKSKGLLELIQVMRLRGEDTSFQKLASEILDLFTNDCTFDTLLKVYRILVQNAYELRFYKQCKELCEYAIELCNNTKEHLFKRYFEALKALSSYNLTQEDPKLELTRLLDEDIGFLEIDSIFVPFVCLELAHHHELQSLFNLSNTWKQWLKKDENSDVYVSETYYKLASDLLDKQLYENGFFEFVPENHEIKKQNLLLRNDAKELLLRSKVKLATLYLSRGEYQQSLKYMESADRILDQYYGISASLRANFKFNFGRLHRHLINTPHEAENQWGTKKLTSLKYTTEILKNEKAELTFLPPTKRFEDALNQAFIHAYHDHSLIRKCLLELSYLYGCKIVEDSSIHNAHTLIAFIYLVAAGKITNMQQTLLFKRRKLLSDSGRQLSEAPPTFLSEALEVYFNHTFDSQFNFLAKNNLSDEILQSSKAIQDAKYCLDLFVQQREFIQTASPNELSFIERRLHHIHKFLLRSCSAYASELLLTGVPDIKSLPVIDKSLVCMQFYTIDTGLFPKRVTASRNMSLTEKLSQKEEEVSIPLVSLFYAITTNTHEANTLPMMGMLSFEQGYIYEMQQKFIALRDIMIDNNVTEIIPPPSEESLVEEISKDAKNAKAKGKEKPVQELTPLQLEIYTIYKSTLEALLNILHNPSTATKLLSSPRLDRIQTQQPKATLDFIRILCQLFDRKGGIYTTNNTELSEWFYEILRCYHQ